MRVISKLRGLSGLRVSPDEAMPQGGILFPSVISALKETYKFTVFPQLGPGINPVLQPAPIGLGFQNGEFEAGGNRIGILQLQIFVSDLIISDVIKQLDSKFGFRFGQAEGQKTHISNLVVQFEKSVEDGIPKLKEIQRILFDASQPEDDDKKPLTVKNLTFASQTQLIINPLQANLMDFSIERRVGAPFSSNRYFCGAPLETDHHIRVLEQIERVLLN